MRILISADGSQWAAKSAKFALQLFRDSDHDVTILVFKQRARDLPKKKETITRDIRRKDDLEGAARKADVIEEEVEDLVADLAIEHDSVEWKFARGDMAKYLLGVAGSYDLVCIGGAGKGGFSQQLLGMIADEIVTTGTGNLMVTKATDQICRKVLVTVMHNDLSDELARYLGTLFAGTGTTLALEVISDDQPRRFEGYLNAASGERLKQMAQDDLFVESRRHREIKDIIESYGVECRLSDRDFESMEDLIDTVDPEGYDLLIIHPPPEESRLFGLFGSEAKHLKLMRRSQTNVMLLRRLD